MSDAHIRILSAASKRLRERLQVSRARQDEHRPGDAARHADLERSTALADARLAAAQARRARPGRSDDPS